MKSEKDSRPHHVSIPPKDSIAIVPPKKVIKALYDYTHTPPDPGYLSFSQGDFLHVVGRENDSDWYEACNPLHNTRGLVPVSYFEGVGKTVRDSAGSARSGPTAAPHDSGYQERSITSPASTDDGMKPGPRQSKQQSMGGMGGMGGMGAGAMAAMMMGKGSGAMVYGIVIYDFKAERPDELEAKEGEAIIVIAQSNPEWFVAKPITRLGGPGLIPVSFIEIRDMSTGKAVPDPQEAVRRAGVPKVEEWKKMAADYKNGSIALGKLEQNSQQTLQQGMERMSLSNKSQTSGAPNGGYGQQNPGSHSRNASMAQRQQYDSSDANLLAPVKASVPRYCFADDIFWFIIECEMSDGRHWELQRLYQDFYDLQIQLIATYPVEAGTSGAGERTLPFMPGPVTYVTDNISNGRRANLDEYIQNLLTLGPHITNGFLVKKFFAPRTGDYEIDPDIVAAEEYRLSQQSAHSSNPSQGGSRQSSADHLQATTPQTPYSTGSNYPSHQRNHSIGSQSYGLNPPPIQHQHSSLSAASVSTTATNTGSGGTTTKIKVWFDESTCVVIRMQSMRYMDLYAKLKERRDMDKPEERDEELFIEYRDETEGQYYPIENDEDLEIAVKRNPKLVMSVTPAR
ncbi:scaffold protein Scd2 [Periconia macrospinosa]|uniref:Scaffold protein Scd2 n=1 Tax=Periconia macrospinosa TaxID=97972 RepID=A0A2V1E6Y8_9PLEO|nr:scaffold protein Scd2 [Periconia macrospinosa]